MNLVFLGEAVRQAHPMLVDPADQVIRYADVQRAA
jgi:hypothetical protein